MTFEALQAELDARGVHIAAVGGNLRIVAPAGAITDALKAALVTHKAALLQRHNDVMTLDDVCDVKSESMPLQRANVTADAPNVTMAPWQVALWADYPRLD